MKGTAMNEESRMHHDTMTAGGGRSLWRWAATFAMLLALIGGSFTQVAAAAPTAPAAPKTKPGMNPNHQRTPSPTRQVAPHNASAQGIAAPGGGTAYGWGYNDDLYFCNGDFGYNDAYAPTKNIYLSGVTAVAAGEYHGLYLLSDGTVYSCGYNDEGLLGNGVSDSNDYGAPQQVLGVCPTSNPIPAPPTTTQPATPNHTAAECGYLTNIKAIAAGYYHSLALDNAGNVYAWGDNEYGELGIGNTYGPEACSYYGYQDSNSTTQYTYYGCSTTPVRVPGLTNVVQIVAGDDFSVALKADGTVWAFGYNYYGQLGQDPATTQCTNYYYYGGNPYTQTCNPTPTQVQGLPVISQVATGMYADHVLALDTAGQVWSWGYNSDGELGRGNFNYSEFTPARVVGPDGTGFLSGVAQPDPAKPYLERIGATEYASYAVMTDGTVYSWGYNSEGELGDGTTNESSTPVHVLGVGGVGFLGNIASLGSGGYETAYAITNDGRLYSWGYNNDGELGIGNDSGNALTPVLVQAIRDVLAVSASSEEWALAVVGAKASPSANNLTFGNQAVGTSSAPQAATLTNSGSAPLTVTGVTIAGANAGDFAQSGGCTGSIAPGGSCSVYVTFTPAAIGARTATLSFATNAGQVDVALSGTGVASAATFTIAASASGSGTVTPTGTTSYADGTVASYTATAAAGQTFTGWTLDGAYVGYANPLTITVHASHTLVAKFVATPTFSDISTLPAADQQMITFLAALGIVNPNGVNGSGQFQPQNDVARAEIAAFIARTFGWENEFHANTFPDRCAPNNQSNCIDAKLWNDVAALKDYGVVGGYTDAATCTGAGTTAPCYLPRDGVKRVQVVSIVARSFIKTPDLRPTGFWDRLAADPAQYTDIATEGTQRSDLTTYRQNAGPVPCQQSDATFGTCETATGPKTAQDNASRLFVIHVLYQAFNAQFGTDRVP
jgi:alpha-tubulin suppressor-like RCC1 family protein